MIVTHLHVKLSSGKLVPAGAGELGAGELGVGTLAQRVLAADDPAAVVAWSDPATRRMVAGAAIALHATVYAAADGKISATPSGNPLGIALEAASGDGSQIEVYALPGLSAA